MKVELLINNNKSRVIGELKAILKLRNQLKIRAQNYFFSPAYRSGRWDGWVKYITEVNGSFSTGLLQQVIDLCQALEIKYTIRDVRTLFVDKNTNEGLGGLTFFDYQKTSINAALRHKVGGISFQRGILAEATNAGKSLIAAGIFASFAKKRRGLFLVNSKTLFVQALADFEKLLPGEVGMVSADKTAWKRVNVCMVQTLGNRAKKDAFYRNELAKMDLLLMDEADEVIGRKDAKNILALAYNVTVRYALTGSALLSKDKCRNQDLISYFGPIIHKTTNKELVEKGISTKPEIRIYMGNDHLVAKGDYKSEYQLGIIKNRQRNKKIWKITNSFVAKGRLPVLILFKTHEHADQLIKLIPKEIAGVYKIEVAHHKTANREDIFKRFNEGKVDILIASMIIKRGKNLPKIRTLINAAGGDSHASVLQIFGRGLRKDNSKGSKKSKIYMIDLFDKGAYLQRHSKHRIMYYKKEGFPVKELYKKIIKKLL